MAKKLKTKKPTRDDKVIAILERMAIALEKQTETAEKMIRKFGMYK